MLKTKIYILFILLTTIAIGLPQTGICEAATAKQAYFQAEACYKKLRNSSVKIKYRDNWLRCIEKFQTVYRQNPDGPWAAAGLYMSGKLYKELSRRSWKTSDRQEALDIFERIIKRYPRSKYRTKAAAEIRSLSKSGVARKSPAPTKSSASSRPDAEEGYRKAEACTGSLKQSPRKMKYRENWLGCIEK